MADRRAETCCWYDCNGPRLLDDSAPPLCRKHLIKAALWTADWMQVNILDPGRESHYGPRAEQAHKDFAGTGSVVYYVRIGDHVKIGTSVNLAKRLRSFYLEGEDALLATEPGDRNLEHMRHKQFAAERVYRNRELFNPSRRLLDHIESLKVEAA